MIKMKNVFFKKLVIGAVSGLMCLTMLPKVPTSTYAANIGDKLTVGNGTNQHKGNCDGYSYEVWIDSTGGSGSMTLGSGAAFTAEWSANVSSGNFLARRGLDFGSQKKATDYPYIGLDYDADYRQTASASGNSRLCVYGWFQNKNAGNVPLVEYYIIEDWVDWCPDASGKMVTIDGAQYKIFQMDHTGPTINGGSETFKQYFSVRQDKRTSGHITVSDHFKAWADEGWGIGNLYEVALNAEGWQSSGIADIKKLDVYTDPDKKDPSIGDTPSTPTVEPDADGNYFKSTFSSNSTDKWKSRGDATIDIDTKNYYSPDGSLFISGRTDNWHGASYSLDTNAFKAGKSYSFSAGVLQKSGETTPMQLTLQYSLDGEENYDQIDIADVKSGEWTKLENTSFEIPAGATNVSIYIEAPESLTDFYIDDVQGSVAGTKSKVVTGGGTVEGSSVVTPPTTTAINPPSTTASNPPATNPPSTTTKSEPPSTSTPGSDIVWGDANCDGKVEIADATLILQFLTNKDEYNLTDKGMINADVDGVPGVTAGDALVIQQLDAGIITSLPLGNAPVMTTVPDNNSNNDSKDVILNGSFDSSADGWSSRGDASVAVDSENFYSGKSLFISGRTDNWNGAAIELDSTKFKAGNSYSFSTAVMQKSGSTTTLQMTLQYSLNGEDHYDQIASADVKSGEWTKLENTSFQIPAGAENLLLYVEAPDSLTDFYIDEAQVGAEGTKSPVVTGKGTVSSAPASNPNTSTSDNVDISWIDPSKPMVAISFDDGAVGNSATDSSMRIINAIANEGFHATFFYVGDWIRNSAGEEEVKYAFSKGMEIANHTKSHPNLTEKSASEIRSEYDQCAAKLKGIIGTEPSKLLRIPYLASNSTVTSTLSDVPMITCSIDTADWNNASKDDIINKVVTAKNNGLLNGAIVLCHETYNTTAEAMEYLAPYLKSEGWQIVTVSEMFAVKQQQLDGGKIYTKTN